MSAKEGPVISEDVKLFSAKNIHDPNVCVIHIGMVTLFGYGLKRASTLPPMKVKPSVFFVKTMVIHEQKYILK